MSIFNPFYTIPTTIGALIGWRHGRLIYMRSPNAIRNASIWGTVGILPGAVGFYNANKNGGDPHGFKHIGSGFLMMLGVLYGVGFLIGLGGFYGGKFIAYGGGQRLSANLSKSFRNYYDRLNK